MVTLKIDGILKKIKDNSNYAKDKLEKVILEIEAIALDNTLKRFDQGIDPDGKKWKKLSKNTIASKSRNSKFNSSSNKILQNTGRLKNSIKSRVKGNKIIIGTSIIYAKSMQDGIKNRVIIPKEREDSSKKKKFLRFYTANGYKYAKKVKINVPARPFLGFGRKEKQKYLKLIYKRLIDKN